MSCSLSHAVGNFYARRHAILPEDLEDSLLLRIHVPAGTHIICACCCFDNEEEILLPRQSVLRIQKLEPATETSVLMADAVLSAKERNTQFILNSFSISI